MHTSLSAAVIVHSVVTDSEFAFESVNFSPVRPSPNPRISLAAENYGFETYVRKNFSPHFSINLYHQNPVRMPLTPFSLTHRYTTTTT